MISVTVISDAQHFSQMHIPANAAMIGHYISKMVHPLDGSRGITAEKKTGIDKE
jgi:hypothetical protein